MNFPQARAISATGLHVRRAAWTDASQWWIYWRGVWWLFAAGVKRVVQATDYTAADLTAQDYTTVPAALVACPITPTAPIGGSPPTPGSPGFPTDPTPPFPGAPGSPSPGGDPITTLPPPNDNHSITVTFAGMTENIVADGLVPPNGPFVLIGDPGGNSWSAIVPHGTYADHTTPLSLQITVTRNTDSTFNVMMQEYVAPGHFSGGSMGGFQPLSGGTKLRGIPANNFLMSGDVGIEFGGGTATVT